MTTNNAQTEKDFIAQQSAKRTKPQGFTPQTKSDRPPTSQPEPAAADSNRAVGAYKIDAMREGAIALSATSHAAMSALQSAGLQDAAAYVQRKQAERNLVVDKVSDAIAYLSDPGVLEADIMSTAAAKVQARNSPWAYQDYQDDDATWDNLFALPASSQRLLNGV
jgi:hypothetical protein